MKKILIILILIALGSKLQAQNFTLSNPHYRPAPTSNVITFGLKVSEDFVFSSEDQNNSYGVLTIGSSGVPQFTSAPSGNGAELFNWKRVLVRGNKEGSVYTWIGTTKNIKIVEGETYRINISVSKISGNAAARIGKEDVLLIAQFTDPGGVPAGNEYDNTIILRGKDVETKTDN